MNWGLFLTLLAQAAISLVALAIPASFFVHMVFAPAIKARAKLTGQKIL